MRSKSSRRRNTLSFFRTYLKPPDWWILVIVVFLTVFGMLMIYNASSVSALRDFDDRFHFLREQFKWAMLGGASMIFFTFVPYKKLYHLALPMLLTTIVLLFAVFIPGLGIEVLGAKRWLNMFFFAIQPAEFAKFALVVYLAAWFCAKERGRTTAFLLLLTIVVGLVVAEPDLGTAIVILAISGILYFFAGVPFSHVGIMIPVGIALVIILSITSPYRFNRLVTFFNPSSDPLGTSYHMRQVVISLGSGGWFGVGLGKSLQKYEYLPEAMTDSIFAIIGEELGFAGTMMIVLLFVILVLRAFRIAARTSDPFARLLALGIITWIGFQASINVSTMVALLPLTGIPLPFISYGGSSLVSMLAATGILLNISRSGR